MVRKITFKIVITLSFFFFLFLFTSCEGPVGLSGSDANENCKLCHNPTVVDYKVAQYQLSKHFRGDAAYGEAGTVACAPCHESAGFNYVCTNNTPSTFTLDATSGKYVNNYITPDTAAFGEINCRTCHSSIHKTYDKSDFYPLTSTEPVPMTMWSGTKTLNLSQNNGKSNLCLKCHQPRPIATSTTLSDGNVLDYNNLVSSPTAMFYDSAVGNAKPNILVPSYRTHVHYGGVGAIYAGVGGIEFPGPVTAYTSSKHALVASCQDCHMGALTGGAGGHTFNAKGNFKGCNVTGCHSDAPYNSKTDLFVNTQKEIKALLETLASRLTSGGIEFLHRDPSSTTNLWYGITTNNYDGYLNIYDPATNPSGAFQNPAPLGTWLTSQKTTNKALPKFTSLKNVQMGAIINFQLCLREYSLGIHNYEYSKALLTNTLDALTLAGF